MPGENFPGDRIVSLVDELEGLIEEAKPPFGKNAQFKVIYAALETTALFGNKKARFIGRILGMILIAVGIWVGFI